VIGEIYRNTGSTRGEIWEDLGKGPVREDSADADLFKLLVRDLSTGGIIRQHRETDYAGNFVAQRQRPPRRNSGGSRPLKSAFDDTERYELTALGRQFVHYAMTELTIKIAYADAASDSESHGSSSSPHPRKTLIMSNIEAYLQARTEFERDERETKALADVLDRAASALRNQPGRMGFSNTNEGLPPEAFMSRGSVSINADDWRTPQQIMALLARYHAAKSNVANLWNLIPQNLQGGLQPPLETHGHGQPRGIGVLRTGRI